MCGKIQQHSTKNILCHIRRQLEKTLLPTTTLNPLKRETNLSRFLSDLKNKNIPAPQLQWSIEKNITAYSHISKRCLLCLHKMLALITFKQQHNLLNKRSELRNKCRHENMFLSNNYKRLVLFIKGTKYNLNILI